MPHVLLAGAPTGCWTNLGDEAILAGMVEALRAAIPDVAVTVVASSPAATYPPYGCDSVRFDDLPAMAAAVAASDAVLLGGGSIFFDYWGCDAAAVLTPKHQGVSLWAGLALLAAADGIPVMTYDVGVGPLRTADGQLMARATFQLAEANTVRDNGSRQVMLDWGLATGAVTLTGDPAIRVSLAGDGDGAGGDGAIVGAAGGPGTASGGGPLLGVALRQWDGGLGAEAWNADTWNAAMASAVDAHLERTGGRALFVASHRAVRWPLTDDGAAAAGVIARMRHADRVDTVAAELPWRERVATLARCDAVLAMRYHAALFALRAGVPTVALSYDAKVAGLLADWGLAGRCLQLGEAAADPQRIADLLADPRAGAASGDAVTAMWTGGSAMLRREHAATGIAARLVASRTSRTAGPVIPGAGPAGPVPARDAVRELLSRMAARSAERPPAITDTLQRLARRVGGVTVRRDTVAVLTNRLVDRTTGKPQIGGAERYALSLGRLLRDLGFDVEFYQGGGSFDVADFHGFPVHPIAFGEAVSEFQVGIGAEFHRHTESADHVIYLMPNYAVGPMREDAVVVSHGVWWDHELWTHLQIRSPEWHEQLAQVFARPRRVISVDANTGNVIRALLPAADGRIRHIPSAVDTRAFAPPARRAAPADDPLVIFPRRAEAIRGSALVGPILDLVPDPCRFRWVGGGSAVQVAALGAVARRDPRLAVTTASFDQMPAQYAAADICVIPTVASEGQSLACLEAMASGCAVVVTRVGGLPELVTDGVDGLVCEPTAESLAAAIRTLVRDPALRARLGAAARGTALRHGEDRWRAAWAAELVELGWLDRAAASAAVPYDVVVLPVIDFEQRYQRPQQIAATWGRRGRRVFYVRRDGHLPPGGPALRVTPLAENVYEVRLALPPGMNLHRGLPSPETVTAAIAALDELRARWSIDRAVAVTEFGTWHPIAMAARTRFGWPVLYDCMDNWATFPGFSARPEVLAAERELVRTADVMTVSAQAIQERWAAERPDAALARNAADFAFFHDALVGAEGTDGAAVPQSIADITGPIAGFVGAIVEWFDVELMRAVAVAHPDVTFVLVGGVARVSVAPLAELANVRLLGQQPYSDMPGFLRRFDVCLVPFLADGTTATMDLVKVYEYFAQGKPVVCTPVAEMVRYRRYLYLADGADEFGAQLDRALAEAGTPDGAAAVARRITMARLNSWDDRVDVLERAILPVLSGEARGPAAPGAARGGSGAGDAATAVTAATAAQEHRAAASHAELVKAADRAQADLKAARASLAAARAKLDSFDESRAFQAVRRYWKARELLARKAKGARRRAGVAYRGLRGR